MKIKRVLEPDVSDLMSTLRGMSALIVAFAHAFQIFCLPYFGLYGFPHLFTSWLATYAVVTFFIVSGFMIFFSVDNHTDSDGFKIKKFFKARFFRVFPPLLLSLLICIIVYFLMDIFKIHGFDTFRLGGELFVSREKVQIEWERFIPTLFLTYNIISGSPPPLSINGPLWTLSYEWWFYLFAMFLVQATSKKQQMISSKHHFYGYLPVAIFLVLFYTSPSGLLLWVFLLIWYSGYLLAYIYKNGILLSHRFHLPLIFSGGICFLLIIAVGQKDTLAYLGEPLQRHGNPAHLIMMLVAFIFTIMIGFMIRGRSFHTTFFTQTASFSYTLYLIHFPILLLAFGLLHQHLHTESWGISFITGIVVTLFIVGIASKLAKVVENRELIQQKLQGLKR